MEVEVRNLGLRGARVELGTEGKKTSRGVWKIPGIGIGHPLSVYSTSVGVAYKALMRRVLYRYDAERDVYDQRFVPSRTLVQERLGDFFRQIAQRLPVDVVKCRLDQYPTFYSGGKRKTYERAVDSLSRWAYDGVRDALVKGFVKVEPTQPGKDPRLIQTRGPRYHATLGCFIRPVEKHIYRAIDKIYGARTIVKGLNAGQIGELIREKFESFSDPVAVGLDASRFDRSVSVPLLEMVHSPILHVYGNDPELVNLFDDQLHNRGVVPCSDGVIKYRVEGGIMSGDVDTSLKGCALMTGLVWAWTRHRGVRIQLVDNGDDCVAFMERRDLDRFRIGMEVWFRELGLDIVAEEPVYVLEKVVFCQSQPVLGSNGTYVMCRNPITASVKDAMTTTDVSTDKRFKIWMASVAACGLSLAGDMPIFHTIYESYERSAPKTVDRNMVGGGLRWLSHGMKRRHGVTDATRYSFYVAFGIPPHAQVAIEDSYRRINVSSVKGDPDEIFYPERFHWQAKYLNLFSF